MKKSYGWALNSFIVNILLYRLYSTIKFQYRKKKQTNINIITN